MVVVLIINSYQEYLSGPGGREQFGFQFFQVRFFQSVFFSYDEYKKDAKLIYSDVQFFSSLLFLLLSCNKYKHWLWEWKAMTKKTLSIMVMVIVATIKKRKENKDVLFQICVRVCLYFWNILCSTDNNDL